MKLHKGDFYFPSYSIAREYAVENGHPTDRIIEYQIGWAIQLRVSGPYVGPETATEGASDVR